MLRAKRVKVTGSQSINASTQDAEAPSSLESVSPVPAGNDVPRHGSLNRASFQSIEGFREHLLHIDASSMEADAASIAAKFGHELVVECWSAVDSFERNGRRYHLARRDEPESAPRGTLTPAEWRVFRCAELGWSNKLVAYSLGISRSTVATLLARARSKLARQNRLRANGVFVRGVGIRPEPGANLRITRISDHLILISVRVDAAPDDLAASVLTDSERTIVALALRGLSNAAIARQRQSSPRTIANQLAAAYKKLRVGSRRELRARFGR